MTGAALGPTPLMKYAPEHDPKSMAGYQAMNDLVAKHVHGYSAQGGSLTRLGAGSIAKLFAGASQPTPASAAYAIYDARHELLGAAIVEPRYDPEWAISNPERARDVASVHAVLAGMFVVPKHRNRGVGRRLIEAIRADLVQHGVRYLEGFSDERTKSAEFYAAVGADVQERDAPIPPRWPTNFQSDHPAHLNIHGYWFSFDIMRDLVHVGLSFCSTCGERHELELDVPGAALVCSCTRGSSFRRH